MTAEAKIKCEDCGCRFSTQDAWKDHKECGLCKPTPYAVPCRYCGKSFASYSDRSDHEQTCCIDGMDNAQKEGFATSMKSLMLVSITQRRDDLIDTMEHNQISIEEVHERIDAMKTELEAYRRAYRIAREKHRIATDMINEFTDAFEVAD